MKKQLFIIFLSVVLIFATTINACADIADQFQYIDQQFDFIVNSARDIVGYDKNSQYFNDYVAETKNASSYGTMINLLYPTSQVLDGLYYGRPFQFFTNGVVPEFSDTADSQFRGCIANRNFVDRLYQFANGVGITSRYTTLDEYGITLVDNNYQVNTISVVGNPLTYKPNQIYNSFEGYYDLSNAYQYNGVTFLSGDNTPPIMFVPKSIHVYQNNVDLYNNSNSILYIMAGNNLLYGATITYITRDCASIFRNFTSTTSTTPDSLQLCNGNLSEVISDSSHPGYYLFGTHRSRSTFAPYRSGVRGNFITSETEVNSVFQLFNALKGQLIALDDNDIQPIQPPDDIPYDDTGNVVIYYNVDNSDDVNINYDLSFMPIDSFNDYITNNDIDYNYTYNINDDHSINTAINNYYYFTVYGGGGFDDTMILAKLQTIIDRLDFIIQANDVFRNRTMKHIFSAEPIYDNFLNCISDNCPVLTTVHDFTQIDLTGTNNGSGFLESWLPALPVQSGSTDNSDDNDLPAINFNHFPIDLAWYEPYRANVRLFLRFPVWGACIASCFAIFKRFMGVGGDN